MNAVDLIPGRKYKTVSNKDRLDLIYLVLECRINVKKAAKIVNMNYNTAKTILRIYKKEKRFLRKNLNSDDNKPPQKNHIDTQPETKFSSFNDNFQACRKNSVIRQRNYTNYNLDDLVKTCSDKLNIFSDSPVCKIIVVDEVIFEEDINNDDEFIQFLKKGIIYSIKVLDNLLTNLSHDSTVLLSMVGLFEIINKMQCVSMQ